MPVPKTADDALLIVLADNPTGKGQSSDWDDIVSLAGPTPLRLRSGMEERRLFLERVKPGTYTVAERALRIKDTETPTPVPPAREVEVRPGTINFFPIVFKRWVESDGKPRTGAAQATPDDQRTVTREISDYLNFGEWIGRRFVGFGPYRPRFSLEKDSYPFEIATRPPGARLLIDGQDFGTTPLTADLAPGRHQLTAEKQGFAVTRTYVTVESEGEIEVPLTALAGQREGAQPGASRVLLAPLTNLAPPAGQAFGSVLDDSLEIGLGAGTTGLDPVRAAATASSDLAAAESAGADFLAHGRYLVDGAAVLVQAELVDVRTRMTRAATLYEGPTGLAMFKDIDAMVEELTAGAHREIPAPGDLVVARSDPLRSLAYDRKRTENEVIVKRQQRRTSVAAQAFLGGEFDTIKDPAASEDQMRLQTNGPAVGIGLTYERDISGPISLAVITNPILAPASHGFVWEIPLYLGPRYTFAGYRTDLYWGLMAEGRYAGEVEVESEGSTRDYGPYWIGGVTFDTGLKLYTYDRMSRPARFVNIGMMISILGVRTTTDFGESASVPLALWMYAGLGGRL
jgi:hypothetical protein